jgi:hypothetical protein
MHEFTMLSLVGPLEKYIIHDVALPFTLFPLLQKFSHTLALWCRNFFEEILLSSLANHTFIYFPYWVNTFFSCGGKSGSSWEETKIIFLRA